MRPADSSERVLTPEAPALGPSRRLALCLRSRPGRAGRWGGGRRVGEGPLHPRGRDPCGLLGNRSAVAWDPAHTPRHHPAVHSRRKRAGPRDTHTGAGQGRAHGGRSGARAGPVRGAHGGRTASGRRTPEKPASPGSPRPRGGQAGRALPRPPRLLHEPPWVRRSGLRGRGHWGSGLQDGDSRNLGSGVDALGGSQHAHALESGFAHVSS